MDVGIKLDIHQKKKKPFGERLALMALGKVYGENILCESLELKEVTKLQDKIMLKFRHAGSGIYIKGKKLNALRVFVDEKERKGITTKVEGNVLTLTSP